MTLREAERLKPGDVVYIRAVVSSTGMFMRDLELGPHVQVEYKTHMAPIGCLSAIPIDLLTRLKRRRKEPAE